MIGVLIINLGTPDSPSRADVRKYLKQFLLDPRVIDIPALSRNLLVRGIIAPFRSGPSSKLYQELWTPEGSPLKIYGQELVKKVQQRLGPDFKVVLAMRYQSPSIEYGLKELLRSNVEEIVIFPLFPQYASATIGSVHAEVMRIMAKEQVIPKMHLISDYHDNSEMLDIFVENARKHEIADYDHILFSFHGVPQRQLIKADLNQHCLQKDNCCHTLNSQNLYCYSAQCHHTSRILAKKLALSEADYTTCFQSRLGKAEWTKPYTSDVLKARRKKGDKNLLVFSPAFTADCLETIIEIGEEYQEEWHEMGGEKITLVESLNADDQWAECIKNMILAEV